MSDSQIIPTKCKHYTKIKFDHMITAMIEIKIAKAKMLKMADIGDTDKLIGEFGIVRTNSRLICISCHKEFDI